MIMIIKHIIIIIISSSSSSSSSSIVNGADVCEESEGVASSKPDPEFETCAEFET